MFHKLEGHRINRVDVVIGAIIACTNLEGAGTHRHGQLDGFWTRLGRIHDEHTKEPPESSKGHWVCEGLVGIDTKLCRIELIDNLTAAKKRLECHILEFSRWVLRLNTTKVYAVGNIAHIGECYTDAIPLGSS